MATETPATPTPIDLGNTVYDRPKLRCLVPEYSPNYEFYSESALRSVHSRPTTHLTLALTHFRKHDTKHSKPFIYQVLNCKHTRFGDKGGLDRHNREVHGSQTHFCPITSCKPHQRGFPRKYNLFEYQKRYHSSQSLDLVPPSILRQQNHTSDNMKRQEESYNGESSSETATVGGRRLREKLGNLHKMRAEIDTDIQALERSWAIMGEDSP